MELLHNYTLAYTFLQCPDLGGGRCKRDVVSFIVADEQLAVPLDGQRPTQFVVASLNPHVPL
jgi:hypothetical protein